jgi:hypothetical protein
MNKRIMTIALFAIVAICVLAAWLQFPRLQPEQTTLTDDFENSYGEWIPDSGVPRDPNNPAETVAWTIERVSNNSYSGIHSLLLQIDGRQDDGTIWIERNLELQANSLKHVNLSFQLWSESESFNTIAVVVGYIGLENPEKESDFQVIGPGNQVAGWKEYSLSTELNTGGTGEVFVALGISVRWETEMSYFVDSTQIVVT